MSEETPLGGGAMTDGVVRIGDTVRRPSRFAPQLMRDVLVHLAQGFRAPEFDSLPTLRPLPWTRGSTTTSPTRRGPDADLAGRARPRCCGTSSTASRSIKSLEQHPRLIELVPERLRSEGKTPPPPARVTEA
jgi:hypothetical protein